MLESRVLEHLRKNPKNRPKRQKTLERAILTLAGNSATADDVSAVIEKLCTDGRINIGATGAVTYHS
jgi:hypothetical protein